MKKTLTALAIAMLICGTAYAAAQDVKECTVSINVPGNFYLDLGAAWIDFGTIQDGNSTPTKNLTIRTISSTGNSWDLKFKNTALASETDPTDVILPANTYVQFNKDGSATGTSPYATTSHLPGPVDAILYASGTHETGNLNHTLVLSAYVPVGQPAGFYKSIVTFTMVER